MIPWLKGLLFCLSQPFPQHKEGTMILLIHTPQWLFSPLLLKSKPLDESRHWFNHEDVQPHQKVTYASAVTYCRTVRSSAAQIMHRPLKQLIWTLHNPVILALCGGGGVYEFCVLKWFWSILISDWIERLVFLSLLSLQNDQWSKLIAQSSGCSLIRSPKQFVTTRPVSRPGCREGRQRRTKEAGRD